MDKSYKEHVNIRYIHRDINGALNILKLGLLEIKGLEHPLVYRRRNDTIIEIQR